MHSAETKLTMEENLSDTEETNEQYMERNELRRRLEKQRKRETGIKVRQIQLLYTYPREYLQAQGEQKAGGPVL